MKRISRKKFGMYIQQLREAKAMSRAELAEKLFVTEAAVWKWEKGKRYPDFETLGNLAEELGVSTQDIYDNSREEAEGINVVEVVSVMLILVLLVGAVVFGVTHIKRGGEPAPIVGGTEEQTTEASSTDGQTLEGIAIRIETTGGMLIPSNHIHDTRLMVDIQGEGPTYIDDTVEGVDQVHTGDTVRLIADGQFVIEESYPAHALCVARVEVLKSGSRKDAQTVIDQLVEAGIVVDATCACMDDEEMALLSSEANPPSEEATEYDGRPLVRADINVIKTLTAQSAPMKKRVLLEHNEQRDVHCEDEYIYDDAGYLLQWKQTTDSDYGHSIKIDYDEQHRFRHISAYSTVDGSEDMRLALERDYEYSDTEVTITQKALNQEVETTKRALLTEKEIKMDHLLSTPTDNVVERKYDENGRVVEVRTEDISEGLQVYRLYEYQYKSDDHYTCFEYRLIGQASGESENDNGILCVYEVYVENGNVVKEIVYEQFAGTMAEMRQYAEAADFGSFYYMTYEYDKNNVCTTVKRHLNGGEEANVCELRIGAETNMRHRLTYSLDGQNRVVLNSKEQIIDTVGNTYELGEITMYPDMVCMDENGRLLYMTDIDKNIENIKKTWEFSY